jgi:hypothetical protein
MTRTTFATLSLMVTGLLASPPVLAQDSSDTPAPAPAPEPTPEPALAPAPTPEPAPPPAEPPPAASDTSTSSSEEPKKEDTGLGLEWVWINAEAGYSFADLGSFSSHSLGITTTSSSGAEFGLGAGVRLFTLTAGLRVRDLPLSVGNVVELDGEVGFHSTGNFQAYFGARGGYLFSGSLSANAVGGALSNGGTPADVTFHGGNLGLMLGFDYYFNHYISLGIDANPEFMFIERPPVPLPTIPPLTYQGQTVMCPSQVMQIQSNVCAPYQSAVATRNAILANPVYKESGSSIGLGFVGAVQLGVHF